MKDQDIPLHKWERIQAELDRTRLELKESNRLYHLASSLSRAGDELRDQLKAEVERQANNNKLLLVQQEHEEQTREFLRCELETLKAQVSELINQRNQLLKEKPKICPNCKAEVKFWADHIHSLPNQATSYSCFSSQQLKAEVKRLKKANTAWALGVEQNNTDIVDMQRDEFKRIMALTSDAEIQGLCRRAIATIEQTFPVIVQRDQALKQCAAWHNMARELEDCIITGNNHGYGLRIGDEALARFNAMEE